MSKSIYIYFFHLIHSYFKMIFSFHFFLFIVVLGRHLPKLPYFYTGKKYFVNVCECMIQNNVKNVSVPRLMMRSSPMVTAQSSCHVLIRSKMLSAGVQRHIFIF